MPQLHAYQEHCLVNEYMRTVLALIYKDVLEFHRVAMAYFRRPGMSTPSSSCLPRFRNYV